MTFFQMVGKMIPMVTRIGSRKPRRIYLAEWREYRQLTQKQLGERLEPPVSDMAVSRWERGDRLLNTEKIDQVCYALDIEPMDLYRDPARPSADELLRGAPRDVQDKAFQVLEALHWPESVLAPSAGFYWPLPHRL